VDDDPEDEDAPTASLAMAALEYWARVTASGSPVILCDGTDPLLGNVRIAIAPPRGPGHGGGILRDARGGFHRELKLWPEGARSIAG
jgi:hypothetical protein